MKNLKTQVAVLLLSAVCSLTSAHAQLTPSADAYTNSADPTTNYGAGVQLDVESTQTTYIQFNLSSIPAGYTSADVTQATLKLYVNAVTTAGSFNVDYVNGAWVESTITHTLAPALGTTIVASVPLTTADKNQYILVDVTAAVQAWLSGTPNDGIALVGNSPVNVSFDSKENTTTSHPPELDIVFAGTLKGVTTASGSGLVGGGTSGTLNLSLTKTCAASQVLKWNGTAWVCSSTGTGTITGVTAGTDLTGGGVSGTVTLKLNTATVPLLAAANKFTASQTVDGNLTATGTVKAATLTATNASVSNTMGITSANGGPLTVTASVPSAEAIFGYASASTGDGNGVIGLVSSSDPAAYGVYGYATSSTGSPVGVYGQANSAAGYGVEGTSPNVGVYGTGATGVVGVSTGPGPTGYQPGTNPGGSFTGYSAPSGSNVDGTDAIVGTGGSGDPDVNDFSYAGVGVSGMGGAGVITITEGTPVIGGPSPGGVFVGGSSPHCNGDGCGGDGVDALDGTGALGEGNGLAGNFNGDVEISGTLNGSTPAVKIDDPLDPANKYLLHAPVQSSEMKNIYDGNVTTDSEGHATVQLPQWFEVLNTDFRYQLTVIGQFAQAIVAREIENNRFEIRTNTPNVKVSWQVTGVRQDAYAKAHPLVVEPEKEARLRGFYTHPELYGAPPEKQIEWARHPHMMKKIKEMQARQLATLTTKTAVKPSATQPK